MKPTKSLYALLMVVVFIVALQARGLAYEAGSTHPGLTAQALLASELHSFLHHEIGLELGVFAPLALDPRAMDSRDFRKLQLLLLRLDPAGGYRPDTQWTQRGAGWLMAGSVLAALPAAQEQNHFYCPALGGGLNNNGLLLGNLLSIFSLLEGGESVREFFTGGGFGLQAISALQWVRATENPLSTTAFFDHLAAAIHETAPRRREHHLALALLAMGGVLHLLQDMASPTHVRNDYREGHLQKLGRSTLLRGSVYERLVAMAYGQQGLPLYRGKAISRRRLLDFFSSSRWDGLADLTTVNHFSPGTLPPAIFVRPDTRETDLRPRLVEQMPLAKPLLGAFSLDCAWKQTCYLKGIHGPVLAYRVEKANRLRFFLDSQCYTASARHLLPLAVGFSSGLINFLVRGKLLLERKSEAEFSLVLRGTGLQTGKAVLFGEEGQGVRQQLSLLKLSLPAQDGAVVVSFRYQAAPQRKALIIFLDGQDENGERIMATARLALSPTGRPAATSLPGSP